MGGVSPTVRLTSVGPSVGPTAGGYIVTLTGTNYRRAPQPPPVGYTSQEEQQTVAVWFNGVRSPAAFAMSSTQAIAEVPIWTGPHGAATPYPVDVTIQNLDDSGTPITGQSATLAGGFSYDRPSLVKSLSTLQRVMEETIALLRRHTIPNVHWLRSRDYDDAATDHADTLPEATVPRLDLVGPTLTEAPEWGNVTAEETATGATTWVRRQRERTVHLGWTLDGYTSDANDNQAINLARAVADFFTMVKWVVIPADPAVPTGTLWRFEMELTGSGMPAFDVAPEGDGLRHFRCQFEVRGVDLGAQDLPTREIGWTVYDGDSPIVDVETRR
jgi:hypothetical protein